VRVGAAVGAGDGKKDVGGRGVGKPALTRVGVGPRTDVALTGRGVGLDVAGGTGVAVSRGLVTAGTIDVISGAADVPSTGRNPPYAGVGVAAGAAVGNDVGVELDRLPHAASVTAHARASAATGTTERGITSSRRNRRRIRRFYVADI
jgi:hypothetical protein